MLTRRFMYKYIYVYFTRSFGIGKFDEMIFIARTIWLDAHECARAREYTICADGRSSIICKCRTKCIIVGVYLNVNEIRKGNVNL